MVTLEISGYLYAPEDGEYRVWVEADGPTKLHVDGRAIASAPVQLARGIHSVQICYERGAATAFLMLSWDRPAWLELLPATYYLGGSSSQVDAAAMRHTVIKSLAGLSGALVWWALCAGVVIRIGESLRLRESAWFLRNRSLRVFVTSTTLLAVLLAWSQPKDEDQFFYRQTSSEFMMQTLSIADLRDQPIRSLWYLHIQPPLLDAIRTVLAQVFSTPEDSELLRRVDFALRVLFLALYGLVVTLLFVWLSSTTSARVATAASLAFALHPGLILFSTWLDSTLISALLVTWFLYELWRMASSCRSLWRVMLATLLLFFTRSIFQWPFVLAVAVSLILMGRPARKVARFLAAAGIFAGLYVVKQYWLFGVPYTSTFAGYNACRSIGADVGWDIRSVAYRLPPLPSPSAASVLAREKKVNGEYNFNQLQYLRISFALMERYKRTLFRQPWRKTLGAYIENFRVYLKPSSQYVDSPVVARLPWRKLYDTLFAGPVGAVLFLLALGSWLRGAYGNGSLRRGAAMAIPVAFIAAVSILFESGENMRFRFFLEPALMVFLVTRLGSVSLRTTRPAAD
jgi:hypothetical protein